LACGAKLMLNNYWVQTLHGNNCDTYVRLILTEFMPLTDEEQSYVWFQQDSTAYTIDNALAALEGVFGDRMISSGLCLTCSPDHNPGNFCSCGNRKEKVYRMNPYNKEELSKIIQREILQVPVKNFFG
jgi:hypothetical protein